MWTSTCRRFTRGCRRKAPDRPAAWMDFGPRWQVYHGGVRGRAGDVGQAGAARALPVGPAGPPAASGAGRHRRRPPVVARAGGHRQPLPWPTAGWSRTGRSPPTSRCQPRAQAHSSPASQRWTSTSSTRVGPAPAARGVLPDPNRNPGTFEASASRVRPPTTHSSPNGHDARTAALNRTVLRNRTRPCLRTRVRRSSCTCSGSRPSRSSSSTSSARALRSSAPTRSPTSSRPPRIRRAGRGSRNRSPRSDPGHRGVHRQWSGRRRRPAHAVVVRTGRDDDRSTRGLLRDRWQLAGRGAAGRPDQCSLRHQARGRVGLDHSTIDSLAREIGQLLGAEL